MSQPFVRPLPSPVQDGLTINIQGQTPPNANSFSVNLSAGPGAIGTTDIGVHVNPRFNENSVPRNSFRNGQWEAEDRGGNLPPPIQRGAPFECVILVRGDSYMVSFNGQHFCEFRHRLPKERMTHLIVSGDVQVLNATFSGPGANMAGGGYGGAQPGYPGAPGAAYGQPQQPPPYGAPYGQPVTDPYGQPGYGQPGYGQPGYVQPGGMGGPHGPQQHYHINGGLMPGKIIYINGTLAPNSNGFTVNLKYQESGGDTAFHFNPRMNERVAVKNCLMNGSWGQEERTNPAEFPFVQGTPVQMMVLAEQQDFKVAVNGRHFTEYRLRNPNIQAIQWVEVSGDITNVTINCP